MIAVWLVCAALVVFLAIKLFSGHKEEPVVRDTAPSTEHLISDQERGILQDLREVQPEDYETKILLYKRLMELNPEEAYYREQYEDNLTRYNSEENQKLRKEKELYEQVQKVPASDYETNMRLYKELMELNPDKQLYKDKYNHYGKLFEESGGGQ